MPLHVWTPLGEPELQEISMMLRGATGRDNHSGKRLSRLSQGSVSCCSCARRETMPSEWHAAQINGLRFCAAREQERRDATVLKLFMSREGNRDTLKLVCWHLVKTYNGEAMTASEKLTHERCGHASFDSRCETFVKLRRTSRHP